MLEKKKGLMVGPLHGTFDFQVIDTLLFRLVTMIGICSRDPENRRGQTANLDLVNMYV